ncbi:ComEC/Rec2 family competence protein [Fodinicola acaciae]|uniref:ComEC/Rec2 family competence protein n=1 Tax=Fodinicola acaciae TaxID=2681555 RepID=UPI0013D7BFA0|nr:MBL fold metallo-hydrolase [Fodinicola acaciae]
MFELDFLPVETTSGTGSKSGDAIAARFTVPSLGREAVLVVDGGYNETGDAIVKHLADYYDTDHVDLMISTHPDMDHLNGLEVALSQLDVDELLIHRPGLHRRNLEGDFSNYAAVKSLLETASNQGVLVTEPWTGLTRFDGQVAVLGPTRTYYEQLLDDYLAEVRGKAVSLASRALTATFGKAKSLLQRALNSYPPETLTDDEGDTSHRNNMSVITLIRADNERLLLTGDAGIPALTQAVDYYENTTVGVFSNYPLHLFQVPHHGSRRNLGPTLLDRMFGTEFAPFSTTSACISSAKADEKHPAPKIVNALGRRGCRVVATEGQTICVYGGKSPRPGWGPIQPFPPLDEADDD